MAAVISDDQIAKGIITGTFDEAARQYADVLNANDKLGEVRSIRRLVNLRQRLQTLRLMELGADEAPAGRE